MKHFSRSRFLAPRQAFTGLGLILAAAASPAQAGGWDCSLDAQGEWLCQAGTGVTTDASGGAIVGTQDSTSPNTSSAHSAAGNSESAEDAAIEATANSANTTGEATDGTHAANKATLPTHITHISDDWVPLNQLSEEQKKQLAETQENGSQQRSSKQQGSKQQEAAACCGIYVDPTKADSDNDPAGAEINAHADETDTDIPSQVSQLKGNVQISQGYRYLRADSATLQQNPQQVTLEGNVALREPGLLLIGDRADVQIDENTEQMENAQYLMHEQHIHGSAQSLGRSDTGVISMTDATYSYCPIGSEQWQLNASTLVLDPNDSQGRAHDVTLRVKDVPVFYTPYLQFPLGDQRMSGFLIPSFSSGKDGLDIQTPYYFNLAPDYDLILTPRYISDRGLMLGSNFRDMTEHTHSSLITEFMPNDNDASNSLLSNGVSNGGVNNVSINSPTPDQRWLLKARQDGSDERWDSLVDISAVSDDQYFHDFSNSGLGGANTAQLRKQAQFDYLPDNWRIGVLAKEYQTLDNSLATPHQVLPSLFADGTYALDSGPVISMHQAVTEFDHVDKNSYRDIDHDGIEDSFDKSVANAPVYYDLSGQETVPLTGRRFNLDYNISLPLRSDGAFITPKIGVRHVSQELDETTVNTPNSNPSTTAAVASVDSGLIFERESQWFGESYQQTLEPRLFYDYAQKKNQDDIYSFDSNSLSYSYAQLFRDYRFAGEDYIEDANQVSLGVSSRLLSPTTGRELVNVGVGQTYYLEKREVVLEIDPATTAYEKNRNKSDIVFEAASHFTQHWDVRTETLWNEDKATRDRQSMALRYRDETGKLLNFGYQFLDREPTPNTLGVLTDRSVEQRYISGVYPLDNQWSVVGHWNHDVTNNRDLETIAGFEYGSCCWTARLVARHWIVNGNFTTEADQQDTRNGIFLQFQLKSLGNFGDSVDSLLSNSILGYEDRNKALD